MPIGTLPSNFLSNYSFSFLSIRALAGLSLPKIKFFMGQRYAIEETERSASGDGESRGARDCNWVLRLIETYFASTRKLELSDRTPSGLLHLRTSNALLSECRYLGT